MSMQKRYLVSLRFAARREEADPSTSLRFAQDDNFFGLSVAVKSLEQAWL